jgi:hypothetical protein
MPRSSRVLARLRTGRGVVAVDLLYALVFVVRLAREARHLRE